MAPDVCEERFLLREKVTNITYKTVSKKTCPRNWDSKIKQIIKYEFYKTS
jgi:hypothetical protein